MGLPTLRAANALLARDRENAGVLGDVIGDLLPSALAVALSPVPVVAIVLVLGSPRARTSGPAFALGWIAGLLAVSVAVVTLVGGTTGDSDSDDAGLAGLKLAVGVLFLLMAAKQWRRRPGPGEEPATPAWMATVDSASPARAALLGLALSAANPKNLALTLTAAASIAEAGMDPTDETIATAVFVAVGSVTVAGLALLYLADSARAARPLAAVKHFMSHNNAAIMFVVLLLIGIKLLGDGLAGL
jgi:threonine/homoserine/homoserine lactone efflux protein